jgi:hypothetical protein
MKARPATPDDKPQILALLDLMHAEIGQLERSLGKIEATVDELFNSGRIGVLDDNGDIFGIIGIRGWETWYSDRPLLSDIFVYLTKQMRSWAAFKALVDVGIDLSIETGYPFILSLYARKDTARKEFLFQRYADQLVKCYQFTPTGGMFKKEP